MFRAVEKHTRTEIAHARLINVMGANPVHDDSIVTFWLAETLKYLYLLYSEPDLISLDHFVLTRRHILSNGVEYIRGNMARKIIPLSRYVK